MKGYTYIHDIINSQVAELVDASYKIQTFAFVER
jgi:hypothetical protein